MRVLLPLILLDAARVSGFHKDRGWSFASWYISFVHLQFQDNLDFDIALTTMIRSFPASRIMYHLAQPIMLLRRDERGLRLLCIAFLALCWRLQKTI